MRQRIPIGFLWLALAMIMVLVVAACQSATMPAATLPAETRPAETRQAETQPATVVSIETAAVPEPGLPAGSEVDGTGTALPALPTMQAVPSSPAAEGILVAARSDLALRLGVAEDEIVVVVLEEVQWPDGSLGCPQPGMMYVQVITPGFLVVLQADGEKYEYHTDLAGRFVLCEEVPMADKPAVPGTVEPGLETLVAQAKADLAERLSISVDEIELLEARSVVWPDGSLGCPQPGMAYKQVPQDGALIRLAAGGQTYDYHVGGSRGLFLCEQELQITKPQSGLGEELLPPPGSPND